MSDLQPAAPHSMTSESNRRGTERRGIDDRRRHNYTPPKGINRRAGEDRRSWIDRREEIRRLYDDEDDL